MPGVIDPETLYVDELPGIWSPIQWELTDDERISEVEEQATASLLWTVDVPEAVLRLFLDETDIEQIHSPPKDYNPEQQGEWNRDLVTFAFKRPIRLNQEERSGNYLELVYKVEDLGYWRFEITPEKVVIERF